MIGVLADFPPLRLPADAAPLIFQPPILDSETLAISLQQIRAHLRVIVLTSAGLVLVTAVTVTGTARGLGPAWTAVFVLGSVLAPRTPPPSPGSRRGWPGGC